MDAAECAGKQVSREQLGISLVSLVRAWDVCEGPGTTKPALLIHLSFAGWQASSTWEDLRVLGVEANGLWPSDAICPAAFGAPLAGVILGGSVNAGQMKA